MRERGSNTARPTEKGGGGLPIRSRFGRFRSISARRFVPIRSRSGLLLVSRRVDSVAICGLPFVVSCRFGRFRSFSARRVDSVDGDRHRHRQRRRGANTKKPDSSIGESGFSYRKVSRALNLRLIPLANTRASARSVLLGLVRRSCIVMITSGRRHSVH